MNKDSYAAPQYGLGEITAVQEGIVAADQPCRGLIGVDADSSGAQRGAGWAFATSLVVLGCCLLPAGWSEQEVRGCPTLG